MDAACAPDDVACCWTQYRHTAGRERPFARHFTSAARGFDGSRASVGALNRARASQLPVFNLALGLLRPALRRLAAHALRLVVEVRGALGGYRLVATLHGAVHR